MPSSSTWLPILPTVPTSRPTRRLRRPVIGRRDVHGARSDGRWKNPGDGELDEGHEEKKTLNRGVEGAMFPSDEYMAPLFLHDVPGSFERWTHCGTLGLIEFFWGMLLCVGVCVCVSTPGKRAPFTISIKQGDCLPHRSDSPTKRLLWRY